MQLVGANITNLICRTNILVAVVIGISVLQEPMSGQLVVGVLLITIGISLPGLNQLLRRNANDRFPKIPAKAFVLGMGCGVAWGISPILIKLGLEGSGAPIAGAVISFSAATVALSFSLLNQ